MRECIILATVCTIGSLLSAAPPDECEAWALHGYRVGMSLERAQQIRPMKERDGNWNVKEQGEFRGLVQFTDGSLEYYSALLGGIVVKDDWPVDVVVDVEAVRRKLVQRLGPADKKFQADRPDPQGGVIDGRVEVWIDEACDTMLVLDQSYKDRGAGPVRFAVNVMLRRLSTLPKAQQRVLEQGAE